MGAFLCCHCPHRLDYIVITLSSDISCRIENFEWDFFCAHRNFGINKRLSGVKTFPTGHGGGTSWEMVRLGREPDGRKKIEQGSG